MSEGKGPAVVTFITDLRAKPESASIDFHALKAEFVTEAMKKSHGYHVGHLLLPTNLLLEAYASRGRIVPVEFLPAPAVAEVPAAAAVIGPDGAIIANAVVFRAAIPEVFAPSYGDPPVINGALTAPNISDLATRTHRFDQRLDHDNNVVNAFKRNLPPQWVADTIKTNHTDEWTAKNWFVAAIAAFQPSSIDVVSLDTLLATAPTPTTTMAAEAYITRCAELQATYPPTEPKTPMQVLALMQKANNGPGSLSVMGRIFNKFDDSYPTTQPANRTFGNLRLIVQSHFPDYLLKCENERLAAGTANATIQSKPNAHTTNPSAKSAAEDRICNQYAAGICTRGASCRYPHPPGMEGSNLEAVKAYKKVETLTAALAKSNQGRATEASKKGAAAKKPASNRGRNRRNNAGGGSAASATGDVDDVDDYDEEF